MSTNEHHTQACYPCFPQEAQGEWVWVPKNAPMPVLPATAYHSPPMYRSLSGGSSSTGAYEATMPCTPPSATPTYSPNASDLSSGPGGSPVDMFLESPDFNLAPYLDAYLDGASQPWAVLPEGTASMDLGSTLDAGLFPGLDFSLDLGVDLLPASHPASAEGPLCTLPDVRTAAITHAPAPPTASLPASAAPNQLLSCPDASCGRVFSSRTELRKHERAHRQPARCPLPDCGKGHSDNRALNRHMWAKHPQDAARYRIPSELERCLVCGYEGRRDNLKRHMKRHVRAG